MSAKQYKKRPGTSGIQGQLYETKLISLINFRALHDDTVESFHLATNIDEIGTFDDICLRAKVSEFDKPLALFIQAKHRENDKLFTFNCNNDLAKYFDSYLRIKQLFSPANKNPIFGGKFEDVECFFVMYITAKDDNRTELYQGEFADYLNELIGTGAACLQPIYNDDHVDFLCKIVMEEEVTSLAQNIAKFITEQTNTELSMNNDLMLRYHVLLAQHVWDVSEIQTEGHRIAHFKADFFDSNEEFIVLFKNILCLEVLKKNKSKLSDDNLINVDSLLSDFFADAKENSLSKLIGNVITYENGKLEFINKSTDDGLKRKLNKVNVPQTVVFKAAVIGAKEYLQTLILKVPALFGNKDLAVRGNDDKINKRLSHLTTEFVKILNNVETGKVITIDESLGDGLLRLNGGLASAVSNILVLDNDTGYLKFTDDIESLGSIAKRWYEQLKSKIENLGEYKLDVKVKKFPKLTFSRGEHDVTLVRDFCNRLLFFTNQSDQSGVEDILMREIEDHPCINDVHNFRVRSDVIYLRYHDEIQKVWMSPKVGSYLTKDSEIYINAVTNAMSEPLTEVMNTMHKIKYKDYVFKEESLRVFEESDVIGAIIASRNPVLTAVKLEQYLGKKDHAVLDLEYIFKLPLKSHAMFCKELTNCKDKILIFLSNHIQSFISYNKKLESITKAAYGKPFVVVADKLSAETIKDYFSQVNCIISDNTICLIDLIDESQRKALEAAKAKFQGLDVNLDLIIDGESAELVDETLLNNIIDGETIEIGHTLTNSGYEKIKEFYMDRTVVRQLGTNKMSKEKVMLQTLLDLQEDVVLITAIPGMGKSTLMTHLSLKTKDVNPMVWKLRINLLEHTKILSDWKDRQTDINMLESLRFICDVAICKTNEDFNKDDEFKIELQKELGTVILKNWNGDNFIEFQLKLFLYYYNTQKLIFIFDGFDEIYPHYTDQALALVKSVRDFPRKHKIWITTRSCSNSRLVLEKEFGRSWEIGHFTPLEQEHFLFRFWQAKLQLTELDSDQRRNINELVQFLRGTNYHLIDLNRGHVYYNIYFSYTTFLRFLKIQPKIVDVNYSYSATKFGNVHFDNSNPKELSKSSNASNEPTPLHLYLLAEYILSKIKNVDKNDNKWNINTTNFNFYEYFIENNVKIKFLEKNKIDIYKPDNKGAYEKEKVECIDKHKKLGFYALFCHDPEFIEETELLGEMEALVEEVNDELKNGKEKIGLIRTVVDGIPIFVHMSFAEYFAVEYICDRMKNKCDTVEEKYKLYRFIEVMLRHSTCLTIFKGKCEIDSQFFESIQKNYPFITRLMHAMNVR